MISWVLLYSLKARDKLCNSTISTSIFKQKVEKSRSKSIYECENP